MKNLIRSLFVVAALVSAVPADAAPASKARFSPADFPVAVTTTDQGTFTGTLSIIRFSVENGTLVAVGTLRGTLTDEAGLVTSSFRTVTVPLSTTVAPVASCDQVTLTFTPTDVDVDGLILHLDALTFDIGTAPGDDKLLRNLLCQASHFMTQNKLPQAAHFLTRALQLII